MITIEPHTLLRAAIIVLTVLASLVAMAAWIQDGINTIEEEEEIRNAL